MAPELPTEALRQALDEAGGAAAPASATAQLRRLATAALDAGAAALAEKRSGYEDPVPVLVASASGADGPALVAVVALPAATRADPGLASERGWAMLAHAVGALADAAEALTAPARPADLLLGAGEYADYLALRLPGGDDAAFAALDLEERLLNVDRLRASVLVVGAPVIGDTGARPPIGAGHPLRVAEAIARLGGDPADPSVADEFDDMLATVLGSDGAPMRPHEDPDPARRIARRIVQRLSGMGKWGGFHTEFAHLPRGFAGNDRELAIRVGEALITAGVLLEKPSVGQRHVYLNSRRAGDIHRFIDAGDLPGGLRLPRP